MRKLRNSELNRLSTEEFKAAKKFPLVVILDDVRSMHNVGSVFRTSDAFNVEKLILGGITPTPPQIEIEKTALGATDSVTWIYEQCISQAIVDLKHVGYTIIALEHTTSSISMREKLPIASEDKVVLIFGNEVTGVSDAALKLCDYVIEIPQFGTKHSLNISVSAGVAIWHFVQAYMND